MNKQIVQKLLSKQGYDIVADSLHGKNQSRFTHLVLSKNNTKYFCKINNNNDVYTEHINSALANGFKRPPEKIQFLQPIETLEIDDSTAHIYPYIDREPISNESKDFKDFSVQESSVDNFLKTVLKAITYVEAQNIVTSYEHNRDSKLSTLTLGFIKSLPPTIPYGLEFLKAILAEGQDLTEYRLALVDVQPQNMFWDDSVNSLMLFDFEHLSPQKRYYDHAKFCAQLWIVYGKTEYAKRFTKLMFSSLSSDEKIIAYRYFRFNLMVELLVAYGAFKDKDSRSLTEGMMRWVRKDLLLVVNNLS